MPDRKLPAHSADVVALAEGAVPDMMRTMLRQRRLTALMQSIHVDMRSEEPAIRMQARLALDRMGFID
jgi:hypothetical protein